MSTSNARGRLARRWPPSWPLRPLPRSQWAAQPPTYAGARPALVDAAVKRAQARPSGNWFVLAASRQIRGDRPFGTTAAGTEVVADEDDRFVVSVTFRAAPGLGVPVQAEFTCPEPRTVVMRITEGEGAGSVVEAHATPRGRGTDGRPRTAVIEAVVADSGRPGFALARAMAPALRPIMRRAAARLWRDDLAYAERRYQLLSM